ncbi:RraA family protein [Rhizobium helianthi]|uniref:Putative 4-hydroxy-4-methyl-2-oxoglutarate aldolase n=1 Tax=Rhizobium helianthi TaxID=1132695 RepID=A0ABW4M090_9HYPH
MDENAGEQRIDLDDLSRKLHAGTIADVLDGKGFWGVLPSQVVGKANTRPVLGKACTVRWAPLRKPSSIMAPQGSTWDAVADFLLPNIEDGTGRIYVAGVEDGLLTEYALAGGFSCGHFQRIGFEAMVLGGAVRDAHAVELLTIPVWATNYAPADTQGNYQVKETGTWCRIGNVTVNEGDWIFADQTGIICIPSALFSEVISLCLAVESTEQEIERRVAAGERLYDIVKSLGRL